MRQFATLFAVAPFLGACIIATGQRRRASEPTMERGSAEHAMEHGAAQGAAGEHAAMEQMMQKKLIGNPGMLSPGIMVGHTLYLSGQLGTAGRAGGIAGETRAAIQNARTILQQAGMDLADVVSVTAYLVDVNDFQAFNAAYRELFTTEPRPTRTTVIVKELVNSAKVELTMTAVKSPPAK